MSIRQQLLALRDEKYAAFVSKLIPNLPPERIIGVRTPEVVRLSKSLSGTTESEEFLSSLPHLYLEENGLHSALISSIKDFDRALLAVESFLPYIDNWATSDSLSPSVFSRHTSSLLPSIQCWMSSNHEYTCRFGIGMLMRYFLEENTFRQEFLQWVARIDREEYYVRMMQAWFFATALAKQWDTTLPFISRGEMNEWVRRKAIQKAIESRRIEESQKTLLRSLRS